MFVFWLRVAVADLLNRAGLARGPGFFFNSGLREVEPAKNPDPCLVLPLLNSMWLCLPLFRWLAGRSPDAAKPPVSLARAQRVAP